MIIETVPCGKISHCMASFIYDFAYAVHQTKSLDPNLSSQPSQDPKKINVLLGNVIV